MIFHFDLLYIFPKLSSMNLFLRILQNMANFQSFFWNFSSSINTEIEKSAVRSDRLFLDAILSNFVQKRGGKVI